jgi:S-adenosylmethionine-diacylglycerol 3-amino-3-carboxypropyl transferase
MANFYKRLNYSFGNEDWKTERKALRLKPTDRVICITGSGDRPLHLLLDRCKEVVAIDANKLQNHLLKLKCAALEELSYNQYMAFLGATRGIDRNACLTRIAKKLDSEARQYWLDNMKNIKKGIIYQGAIESLLRLVSYGFRLFRRKKIQRLFEFDNIKDQQEFIRQQWDVFLWRKAFDIALHPWIARFLINDLSTYEHTDPSISGGSYFYNRMNACLNHTLAKEKFFMSLVLRGSVNAEAFPPYLTEQGSQIIKENLDSLSIHTGDLIEYLEHSPENSIDAFSVSDVASYLPPDGFKRLISAVYRTAKPGARFSMRQFLSSHTIYDSLRNKFIRNSTLEKKLESEDCCFCYRYMVGEIQKD